MNHELDRKIEELEQLIIPHKKDFTKRCNQKAIEADLSWNASNFFSKVVYQSEPRNDHWDIKRVKKLKDDFEKNYFNVSNISDLISKHWLREVVGYIQIPRSVSSTCYDFEKVKNHYNELTFVQYLGNRFDKKVPLKEESKKERLSEKDYPIILKNYEKENKLKLDKDHITKSNWIVFKDGYVKPFNIDYYLIVLKNWKDFAFLSYLKNKMYESRKDYLLIKRSTLERIYETHKNCFPDTPSLEEFRSKDTLKISGKFYQLKTYDEDQLLSNYDGKIAAFIWSELANDSFYKNDLVRVNKFIETSQFREHLPSFHKHLSKDLAERFLEAAMSLVLNEDDIKGIDQEIYKAFLDLASGSNFRFASSSYLEEEPLTESDDYCEFYKQLKKRESVYQNNIFFVQESRSVLSFMIWEIMYLDTVYSKHEVIKKGKKELIFYQYANIKRLLSEGLKKPYLLWEVSHLLVQNRPDVIPFLLNEPQFASLAVCLLKKIEINSPIERVQVITQLEALKEGTLLSLTCSLIKTPIDKNNLARLLLHLFQEVTHNKFKVNYNESIENVELRIQQQKEKESLLLYELESFQLPNNINGSAKPKFLISFIFEELCAEAVKLDKVDYLKNGMLSFPLQKLDALCWLSKYCSQIKFSSQIENIEHIQFHISTQFQKIYLETIEKEAIERKDFYSEKLVNAMPNWSERNENLKKIEWIHPVCLLYKHGGLNQFLAPRFNFQMAKDEYDKANRFRADKLRSHVFVLLEILRQLNNSSIKIPYSKEELLEIKCSVERLLTDHLKKYSNSKGIYKIDILDHLFDRSVFRSHEEELLPQIVKVGNYFSNKPSLFNLLLDKENILQLLIILDYVKVRWVETKCIHLLKSTDVNYFLNQQYSVPEIEGVVNKLMLYDELKSQAAIAMSYWESKILPQKRTVESDFNIYEARLRKAYLKGDLDEIKAVEEPKRQHGIKGLFSASDHKMFFVGLYYFDQKDLKSVEIFEKLRKKYPKNRTVALNLFAARITVGTKPLNEILLKEALSDWEYYESTVSLNLLKFIEHQILINKLIVYNELKQHNQFEKLYKVIDDPIKFSEDFVKLRVSFLISLQRKSEAYELLEGAKQFHKIDDSEDENYITELEKEVASTSNIKELRASLNEMKNAPIKTIAEVLQNTSNKGDVGRFFTEEVAKAANKLLVKIKSIEEIGLEDKYNDQIESILGSRLEQWGIVVKEQPRGGLSPTKKSLGERDFSFFNNGEEIAICEAFIGHAKSVVEPHIQKIFNYSHRRLNYYILMYDKNLSKTLTNRWNSYKEKTIPSIEYPDEFAIKENLTVDLTNDFGYENTAIKIASTRHGENTTIYHIMVNLNYEV